MCGALVILPCVCELVCLYIVYRMQVRDTGGKCGRLGPGPDGVLHLTPVAVSVLPDSLLSSMHAIAVPYCDVHSLVTSAYMCFADYPSQSAV